MIADLAEVIRDIELVVVRMDRIGTAVDAATGATNSARRRAASEPATTRRNPHHRQTLADDAALSRSTAPQEKSPRVHVRASSNPSRNSADAATGTR